AVRHHHRDSRGHRAGLKRDREEDAVHHPLASRTALGIHCRKIFWAAADACRQHCTDDGGAISGSAGDRPWIQEGGRTATAGDLLYCPAIHDYGGVDPALLELFNAGFFGDLRVRPVRDWNFCRGPQELCRDVKRNDALGGLRGFLSCAELCLLERNL